MKCFVAVSITKLNVRTKREYLEEQDTAHSLAWEAATPREAIEKSAANVGATITHWYFDESTNASAVARVIDGETETDIFFDVTEVTE